MIYEMCVYMFETPYYAKYVEMISEASLRYHYAAPRTEDHILLLSVIIRLSDICRLTNLGRYVLHFEHCMILFTGDFLYFQRVLI